MRLALRHFLTFFVLTAISPAAALGQAPDDIAAEKARLADVSLSGAERLNAINRVLELRRQLIQSRPNDPQRAIWLADQASDLYFDLLQHDGLVVSALFGFPPESNIERAKGAANEMHTAAAQAESAIDRALMALESAPGYRDDAGLQQTRRELAEVERERRIPFLRGVAAALHAELNVADSPPRTALYTLSLQRLTPLIEVLQSSSPNLALEARLYAGLANARLGQFDAAEEHFAFIARDPAASAAQTFSARLGGVLNRAQRSGPRAALEALDSVESRYTISGHSDVDANFFFRVLIADQRHLLWRQTGTQQSPPAETNWAAQSLIPHIDLLRRAFTDSSRSHEWRENVRSILFERLHRAATGLISAGAIQIEALPEFAAIAHAEHLSRDPATRAAAISILERSLSKTDFDPDARPEAIFILARAMFEHDQPFFAATRFIQLARQHPSNPKSQRAIEIGVSLAADRHAKSPDDREARDLLRGALELLLQRYPNLPTIDHWRHAAARLALDERRFDEAAALLAQITPDANEWPDAQYLHVLVLRARAAAADDPAEQRQFRAQTLAAIDRAGPVLEAALRDPHHAARTDSLSNYLGLLRVHRAQTFIDMNQPEAALQALSDAGSTPNESPLIQAQVLKTRISAYQAMKRPAEALHEMRRLVQTSPGHAGDVLEQMLAAMQDDVEALLDLGRDEQAREAAQTTLAPIADLLHDWLAQQSPSQRKSDRARIQHRIANAYRLSGRFAEALSLYNVVLQAQPDAADLLLGKAECLFHLGQEPQLADSMEIYKRLAAVNPTAAPETYWLSQLRMLQILDRVNRHAEQILPRIERLRQQDRQFGGERFRRGFEALRQKYLRAN